MEAAQQAQMIAGGAAGAGVRVYLLNPGSLPKMASMGAASLALAWAFGESAYPYLALFGMNAPASGAFVALVGLGIAEGAIKAAARLDLMAFFQRGK